jgi:hypothetical protein
MRVARDPKLLLATVLAGAVGLIVLIDAAANPSPTSPLAQVAFLMVGWVATLTALALLFGLLSVAVSHVRRVVSRSSDWVYSLVLLLGMLLVIWLGIVGVPFTPLFPNSLVEEPIRWVFTNVYEPLASSLLALLAFFSLSAALRATRRSSVEAWVIVGVALLALITQLGPVSLLPFVGETMQAINDYLVVAGARGLLIGVSLGTLVATMRVLLGFDQPYLDR